MSWIMLHKMHLRDLKPEFLWSGNPIRQQNCPLLDLLMVYITYLEISLQVTGGMSYCPISYLVYDHESFTRCQAPWHFVRASPLLDEEGVASQLWTLCCRSCLAIFEIFSNNNVSNRKRCTLRKGSFKTSSKS